ncbi:menaquinone-dependent protoporphyrinogen oxidase [Flavobacterium sp. 1]|uniref:menaquinone-dependent protoporphyrinogen IX dehydrogenase n=1 Tax=Flavobacterium sp. 1 TaxID=2035200 RepID=UPI000C2313CF|nr:menaquinone-dependent protoporphyrinogen IX dehydrogenase [Flavobacterium sp. 1]PJJ09838.1 menaquinone-dependent protoporphyrinogen oxidase [Flavobacterium sp. 1]
MQKRTIIIYSSVDGQTKKICCHIKNILILNNHLVDVFSVNDLTQEITAFDKIIIASSIRYGKHNEQIEKLIKENSEFLNSKKTAFISVNLVARKAEKSKPDTNPYVIKFFNSIEWKPTLAAVFPGKLDYKLYSFRDRLLIKLIMMMTKGPINSKTVIEYTNWTEVDEFAKKFAAI